MDKNKKKTIATGLGGTAVGIGGTEAAIHAKDWFGNKPQDENTPEPGHNQDPVADTTANSNAANQQVAQQTSQPTPSHDDYSGITEIQPVDTGGTANGDTADVVIEVPAEEPIAGVDDINPDEIAEAIITPVEDIIDNGTDLASNHQPSEEEILSDDVIIDEEVEIDEDDEDLAESDEDDEDLAESDEDLTDDADDSVMIDDIS